MDEANDIPVIVSSIRMIKGMLERQLLKTHESNHHLLSELVSVIYRVSRAFNSIMISHELCRLCRWLIECGVSDLQPSIIRILATMSRSASSSSSSMNGNYKVVY
jgi:hypothetical protein